MRPILNDNMKWIADLGDTISPLDVVNRILEQEFPDDEIDSVYQSSMWAVCMAYKHYKNDGVHLSTDDLEYTASRGGMIGMRIDPVTNEPFILSLRSYLNSRDYGFAVFSAHPHGPAAA